MKALIIVIFCMAVIVLSGMLSMVSKVDYRQERKEHRKEYIAWWLDRDTNNNRTEREWTR